MRLLILTCLLFCGSAHAEMYARVDKITGHTTYTNIPPPELESAESDIPTRPMRVATKEFVPERSRSARVEAKTATKSSSTPTPASFPRVSPSTQKERDTDRMHILMTELQKELQTLELVEGKKADAETINRHKVNIASLKREIKNIK